MKLNYLFEIIQKLSYVFIIIKASNFAIIFTKNKDTSIKIFALIGLKIDSNPLIFKYILLKSKNLQKIKFQTAQSIAQYFKFSSKILHYPI